MNSTALIFVIVCAIGVLVVPRRWAPLPLLASSCYMTTGQGFDIGFASLPVYRLILAAGLLRVLLRREWLVGGFNTLDKMMIAWGSWLVFAGFFHEWAPGSGPVYNAGFAFSIGTVYFLTRVWATDPAELSSTIRIVAWLLVPLAVAMVAEHLTKKNVFAVFGGIPEAVGMRDGQIRAQGPFQHAILAGTVGAVCAPLMIGIWRQHRFSAVVGLVAATTMVIASTSSTPMMSLLLGVGAVFMWWFRPWLGAARWAVVVAYICAEILMTRPAYYLMSKVDFTGSSTGWYRSRLIQSTFQHFSEWWAFGTDFTAHWMYPPLDDRHADIVNYYIAAGTLGGILAMLLLIAIVWRAFVWVGEVVREPSTVPEDQRFMVWCLGAGFFAHAISGLAVAYFDQSVIFFWLNVGAISAMYSLVKVSADARRAPASKPKRPSMVLGRALPDRARMLP